MIEALGFFVLRSVPTSFLIAVSGAIGLDLELCDSNGATVLGCALKSGDLAIAKLLVQHGAKVDVKTSTKGGGRKTLLEQALENRDEAAILFLIDQGVDLTFGWYVDSQILFFSSRTRR